MNTKPVSTLARALLVGASLVFFSGTVHGADSNNKSRGQWYDPTDWFDPQRATDLKSDKSETYDLTYDYGLGENFDYAIWSTYGKWGTDLGPRSYDADYWKKLNWSSNAENLSKPSGQAADFEIYPTSSRRSRGNSESVRQDSKSDDSERKNRADRKDRSGRADKSDRSSRGSDQSDESEGDERVAHLTGTIESLSNIQLRRDSGATGAYTLAKVRLDNDLETIANLGREEQVRALDLEKGSKIEAVGRRGLIDKETVFVAHRLKSGTVTIDANPTIRLADESSDRKTQTRTGTVGRVREPSSSGSDNTLVELKLDNGESAWVDLGPAASVNKIGLSTGERVTVRGTTREKRDSRDVITASLLRIEDTTQSTASADE